MCLLEYSDKVRERSSLCSFCVFLVRENKRKIEYTRTHSVRFVRYRKEKKKMTRRAKEEREKEDEDNEDEE